MSEAIFTLHYLPSISYFVELLSAEQFLLERHDNFQKASFRNRTIINTANSTMILSIPLQGGRDKHQRYADVKISYATNWQKQHWQSIRSAYGSAPFFEHYARFFHPFYEKEFAFLYEFNVALLEKIMQLLKQKRELIFTETYSSQKAQSTSFFLPTSNDFRSETFEEKSKTIKPYIQVFSERFGFNPNVSVLDLLFCEGTNAVNYLL